MDRQLIWQVVALFAVFYLGAVYGALVALVAAS